MLTVAHPGLGRVGHCCGNLLPLLLGLLVLPLLLEEAHFLNELQGIDVLEEVLHLLIVNLLQLSILLLSQLDFLLVLLA